MQHDQQAVEALSSAYLLLRPNKTVDIYDGAFTVEACPKSGTFDDAYSTETARVRGRIYLELEPNALVNVKAETFEPLQDTIIALSPYRRYRVRVPGYSPADFLGSVRTSSELGSEGEYPTSTYNPHKTEKVVWDGILSSFCSATQPKVCYLEFHLPNIRSYSFSQPTKFSDDDDTLVYGNGSLSVEVATKWKLTLTPPKEKYLPGMASIGGTLEKQGGSAITHVGRIQRKDFKEFQPDGEKALEILDAISNTFTFAFGRYVKPLLLVGRDKNKNIIWSKADNLIIDAYKSRASWSSMLGFSRNSDVDWGKLINCWLLTKKDSYIYSALFWYLRACQSNSSDEKIVITQIGLEVLGWSKEKNEAIRWLPELLDETRVQKSVPASLRELENYRQEEMQKTNHRTYRSYLENAPRFFVGLRNLLVHGRDITVKPRSEIPQKVVNQTSLLGMYYLELAILHALGYNGEFYNWLRDDGLYDSDPVPWA